MLKAKIKGVGELELISGGGGVERLPHVISSDENLPFKTSTVLKFKPLLATVHSLVSTKEALLRGKFNKGETCKMKVHYPDDTSVDYSFNIKEYSVDSDKCITLKVDVVPTTYSESLLHTSEPSLSHLMNKAKLTKQQTFEHTGWMDDAQFSNMIDNLIDKGFSVDSKEIEVEECLISDMLKYHIKAVK